MSNRYLNTKTTRYNETGSLYYVNAIYPDIPAQNTDYYVITTIEDRLDNLAHTFYNDSTLWWVIASANNLPGDSLYPPIGMQLRIPTNITGIVASYKRANNAI